MSVLDSVSRERFFSIDRASDSLDRAVDTCNSSLSQIARPYYDLTSNLKALAHPLFHATQLLFDAVRLVYNAFTLVGALMAGDLSAACEVAVAMLALVCAAVLEVLNIALSLVSLATRFVASICNFGYQSTTILGLLHVGPDEQEHRIAFTLV